MPTSSASLSRIFSFPEERYPAAVPNALIVKERRSKSRYPVALGIRFRFRLRSGGFLLCGVGRTVNLSSGGLLATSQDVVSRDEFREGGYVEFSIEWPVLLDGRIPLQLFGIARVVRRGTFDFAAVFVENQFRTRRSSSAPRDG